MPTASSSASTGEPTANTAAHAAAPRRSACLRQRGAAIQNEAAKSTSVTATSQDLVSPIRPGRPAACGMPNSAIAGRYGLYESTLVSCPAGR